jgi:modulator of FtsH protease HflK
MPWNDPPNADGEKGDKTGGPWGQSQNGSQKPWGSGPTGRNDDRGPDLEEMMRRLQGRVRGTRGPGTGRPLGRSGFMVAGALILAAWLGSGIYMVGEGEAGVVTRFGGYSRLTGPGLHVHLPAPIEDVRVVSVTQQRRTTVGFDERGDVPEESLMITGDEAIVDVNFTVTWQLTERPQDFVFNVRDPEELVAAVAESAMREVVGQSTFEGVISRDRAQVAASVRELMQQMLAAYSSGVSIVRVELQQATAPEPVIEAFNDVDRARADAESRRNDARAQAARLTQEAEGYRERVVRDAAGEAERFNLIYEEYRQNPRVTRERLYLETMERVLQDADKIIVDRSSGVTPYLPLDQLRRGQTAAPAATGGAR